MKEKAARAVPGLFAALIVALVGFAPAPASAGLVYHTSLVCAEFDFDGLAATQTGSTSGLTQTPGTGLAKLETSGANVLLTIKASGLPANSPALCALACVVNGSLDFFDFTLFDYEPCAVTGPSGKLTYTASLPLVDHPFLGGCVVPAVAFLVVPEVLNGATSNGSEPAPVVCVPGFGTFSEPA